MDSPLLPLVVNKLEYILIYSPRRNRLHPNRAEDLVFIHNHLYFLYRNSEQYEIVKNKMWGVGGDAFDSLKDFGFLEFAELSLDEPKNGECVDIR